MFYLYSFCLQHCASMTMVTLNAALFCLALYTLFIKLTTGLKPLALKCDTKHIQLIQCNLESVSIGI